MNTSNSLLNYPVLVWMRGLDGFMLLQSSSHEERRQLACRQVYSGVPAGDFVWKVIRIGTWPTFEHHMVAWQNGYNQPTIWLVMKLQKGAKIWKMQK